MVAPAVRGHVVAAEAVWGRAREGTAKVYVFSPRNMTRTMAVSLPRTRMTAGLRCTALRICSLKITLTCTFNQSAHGRCSGLGDSNHRSEYDNA